MKKKIIIFGAGGTGKRVADFLRNQYDIIAFADNDDTKWDKKIDGIKVINPEKLREIDFDYIALGTLMGYEELQIQLEILGVQPNRIIKNYVENSVTARIYFLKRFSEEVYRKGYSGSVGEAGVFRGEFAKEINRYFFDRKCYLFDTFDGFDERDTGCEKKESLIEANYMHNLSEKLVYEKMEHKENVIIRKGWFPETTRGIEDNFVFINLDMDLYKPTYEGISFFYPRMVRGGIILIHDYFSEAYPNIKQALDDFEIHNDIKLVTAPVGDDISIAIIKY